MAQLFKKQQIFTKIGRLLHICLSFTVCPHLLNKMVLMNDQCDQVVQAKISHISGILAERNAISKIAQNQTNFGLVFQFLPNLVALVTQLKSKQKGGGQLFLAFVQCLLCFWVILGKWTNPGLFFCLFLLFPNTNFTETVDFSGIRTWIIGVEGEHADHVTTTVAQLEPFMVAIHSANLAIQIGRASQQVFYSLLSNDTNGPFSWAFCWFSCVCLFGEKAKSLLSLLPF